jgi:hypothetical protein
MRRLLTATLSLSTLLGCSAEGRAPAAQFASGFDAAPARDIEASEGAPDPAAAGCVDGDGDGFGAGCARGLDCDDADRAITDGCYRCATPAEGCSCANDMPPLPCDVRRGVSVEEHATCHLGERRCVEGRWSACQPLRAPSFAAQVISGCRGNCAPGCERFVDCLRGGVIPAACEGLVPSNAAPAIFCPPDTGGAGVQPACGATVGGYDRSTVETPFLDACSAPGHATHLPGSGEGVAVETLPFAFPWFGVDQRTVTVSTAGTLAFGARTFPGAVPTALDGAATADNTIFAFWDDLSARGGVCTASFGASPARTWVAQWQRARFDEAVDLSTLTFAVVLHELDGAVELAYLTMDGLTPRATGAQAAVGLRGAGAGTVDVVAQQTAGAVRAGTRVRWTPRPIPDACQTGIYRQTFEARCADPNELPVWTTAIVGANVPGGATMRLSARLADAEHAVRAAPIVPLPTVPPGTTGAPVIIDLLPSMRVANPNLATERSTFMAFEATLEASADGRAVPRLDGVELQYECVPAEVVRPCNNGAPCQPEATCARGVVRCENSQGGRPVERCEAAGLLAPGSACGTAQVCDATGRCVRCEEGAACRLESAPCAQGTIQCDTGSPVCVATATSPVGSACGGSSGAYARSEASAGWDDACAAPGRVTLATDGDGWRAELPLALTVFGAARRALYINPAGIVSFTAQHPGGANAALPTGGLDAVFPFWDDLDPARPPCVAVVGPAYARRVVVEWSHTRFRDGTGDLDFEVVLHEGADAIDVLYRTLRGLGVRPGGSSATVGLQRGDGGWYDQVGFNTVGAVSEGMRLRWSPAVTDVCDAAGRCTPCVPGAPCSAVGVCAIGTTSCDTGVPVCDVTGSRAPTPEACNGVDDDCDGVVDDGCRPCVESSAAASGRSGAVWQINRGSGPRCWADTTARHGDPSEYAYTTIPPESDPSWAPHGNSISFADPSTLCGVCDCRRGGDFTHFQTVFTVPPGFRVSSLQVTMGFVDDGARLTLFNASHPDGVVDPGSYAYYPAGNTTDLAALVSEGRNRVVLTHVDDCCRDRVIAGVGVLLNNAALASCDDITTPTNCLPGWSDCNASPWDGCEEDLATSSQHCGACGNACAAGAFCEAGRCVTGRCNDGARNGDETDVDCGGSCVACAACRGCRSGNDCATGLCEGGQCTYRTEVSVDWVRSCAGAGGLNIPVERDLPAGRYLFTPLESAGATSGVVRQPDSGWTWLTTCAGLPSSIPSTATRWATPAEAWAAVRGRTATFDWAGGPLRCIFPDDPCADNHGGVRFGLALQCPTPPPMQCSPGFADCDGAMANGCEVNTANDVAHCGACGTVCPSRANASTTCGAGACGMVCATGFGDCDGSAATGCEADLRASTAHCGACGRACAARPNTVASCTEGACAWVCEAGFGDCDGDAANGCEVDLRSAPASCGACGRVCALPNATAGCASAACTVTGCAAGYADCDGAAASGCEAQLATDTLNCGACARVCATGERCVAGACVCALGETRCGATCANLSADSNHCGACGNVCATGRVCRTGSCQNQCASGNVLCGTQCVTLGDDPQNCGACGNVCAAGSICGSGTCVRVATIGDVGCADGTREAFADRALFPRIAACSGAWSLPGIFPAIPASTDGVCETSGNSSTLAPANGASCASSNLCARGWHICNGGEVLPRTANVGCLATADYPPGTFYAAAVSGTGCGICALRAGTVTGSLCTAVSCAVGCTETGDLNNDFFGCGSLGAGTVGACDGLNRFSHNNCSALTAPWACGGASQESRTVTKSGPAAGGVLCCRD